MICFISSSCVLPCFVLDACPLVRWFEYGAFLSNCCRAV